MILEFHFLCQISVGFAILYSTVINKKIVMNIEAANVLFIVVYFFILTVHTK
jgi:hypothetical protein